DQDDAFLRKICPVVGARCARSARQRAAVNPDHHRALFTRFGRRPHIQIETIFALFAWLRVKKRALRIGRLRTICPEVVALANSLPRDDGLRRFPAQVAHRWRSERNAFKTADAVRLRPRDRSSLYLDRTIGSKNKIGKP